MKKTGFICDEKYFWHNAGTGALFMPQGGYIQSDESSENPETKRRFKNLLEVSGLMDNLIQLKPRYATTEEVGYYHPQSYIKKVKELSDKGYGDAGSLAIVGKDSYEIALLSVGGALTAVEAVVKGELDNAYALTRPPGHHAEADQGMGYCIFNNVVIAAEYARKVLGLERIMIIDWDVHHGNGTESAFYDDPNVLFFSLHQERLYPAGRGNVEDVGTGEGLGKNVNIPLPAGTSNAGYMYALNEIVGPIATEFKPQLILISSGQDAGLFDPLARMMLTMDGFRQMTKFMVDLADKLCEGKLVACHEGGYSAAYVPFCSLAIVEELNGTRTGVEDPFVEGFKDLPFEELFEHQKASLDKVIEEQSKYWSLSVRT